MRALICTLVVLACAPAFGKEASVASKKVVAAAAVSSKSQASQALRPHGHGHSHHEEKHTKQLRAKAALPPSEGVVIKEESASDRLEEAKDTEAVQAWDHLAADKPKAVHVSSTVAKPAAAAAAVAVPATQLSEDAELPEDDSDLDAPAAPVPHAHVQVQAPKVQAPKVQAPKVEALKVEAPKVEAPKVEVEETAIIANKGPAPPADAIDATDAADAGDDAGAVVSKQLTQELEEARQRRANVGQIEKALAADVALLREGTSLRRISVSRRGRAAADKQVLESERVVKDTGSMLRESREASAEDARSMLREAAEVRAAAEGMAEEAREQLRLFAAAGSAPPAHAADAGSDEPAAVSEAPPAKAAVVAPKKKADIEDLDDDA